MKKIIVFIDSGDTLVDESTEIRNEQGIVIHAELFDCAAETLRALHADGYIIALVADGMTASFDRVYNLHQLNDCFAARIISEEVGAEKPSEKMFQTALDRLGLSEKDKSRIVMVGNNLKRDIIGANRFGIISVLAEYSPRYSMRPEYDEEKPAYKISAITDLPALLDRLESSFS